MLENIKWEHMKMKFHYVVFGFDSVHKPYYVYIKFISNITPAHHIFWKWLKMSNFPYSETIFPKYFSFKVHLKKLQL